MKFLGRGIQDACKAVESVWAAALTGKGATYAATSPERWARFDEIRRLVCQLRGWDMDTTDSVLEAIAQTRAELDAACRLSDKSDESFARIKALKQRLDTMRDRIRDNDANR